MEPKFITFIFYIHPSKRGFDVSNINLSLLLDCAVGIHGLYYRKSVLKENILFLEAHVQLTILF